MAAPMAALLAAASDASAAAAASARCSRSSIGAGACGAKPGKLSGLRGYIMPETLKFQKVTGYQCSRTEGWLHTQERCRKASYFRTPSDTCQRRWGIQAASLQLGCVSEQIESCMLMTVSVKHVFKQMDAVR